MQLTAFEPIHEGKSHNFSENTNFLSANVPFDDKNSPSQLETPNTKKKRHARKTSGGKNGDLDDTESFEFVIVSIDNQQWHFEAASVEVKFNLSVLLLLSITAVYRSETSGFRLSNSKSSIVFRAMRVERRKLEIEYMGTPRSYWLCVKLTETEFVLIAVLRVNIIFHV